MDDDEYLKACALEAAHLNPDNPDEMADRDDHERLRHCCETIVICPCTVYIALYNAKIDC